jgi:2-polyprenyl-3-methyl-5-hydroxy-6-metoxy-1,4-benzoquinol methylase
MSLETIPCAICDSTDVHHVYDKFNLPVSRCVKCGLVFATPRIGREQIWSRYSPSYFYDEYLPAQGVIDRQFDLAVFDARHAEMLALIAAKIAPPGRMVEIGTGAGFFLKAAERAGWACSGIEVSQEAADFARTRLELDVRQGTAEDSGYPDGSVDVAIMFEVIEHLLDPRRSLEGVRRALRPGGRVVVSTPNFNALSRRALGAEWTVISPIEHLYYFTEATLERLLRRAGFTDVEFARQFRGFGVMNPASTHSVGSWRSKAYQAVVKCCGPALAEPVRRYGLGDTLVCFAARPAG